MIQETRSSENTQAFVSGFWRAVNRAKSALDKHRHDQNMYPLWQYNVKSELIKSEVSNNLTDFLWYLPPSTHNAHTLSRAFWLTLTVRITTMHLMEWLLFRIVCDECFVQQPWLCSAFSPSVDTSMDISLEYFATVVHGATLAMFGGRYWGFVWETFCSAKYKFDIQDTSVVVF